MTTTDNNNNNDKDEQHINKRQKLDNNNENNGVETEIDIINLEKKTVVQLKEIATSLGVSIKSGTKKNDIVEQIKAVHKRKQEALAKQIVESNINSFNKGIIEFKIKDGVDPSEWLFWKVFRNKFIYKRIMSNMDTRFSIPYDSIISVTNMLILEQFEILRDKVIRNQPIVLKDQTEIIQTFKTFKQDNDQDRLFYKQFFKYYGKYILKFNAIEINDELILDGRNDREGLVNLIISAKCLPALQILVQEYQYQPTISNLQHSIKLGALKFIKFIFQQQPKLKDNIHQILLDNITTTKSTTKLLLFKSLYWLNNEKIIDPTDNILFQYIQSSEYQIDENISLKLLIIICKILLSTNWSNVNNRMVKQEDIDSFSNSLTKQELSLPLSNPSFQIQDKKEFILKLLDFYYSTVPDNDIAIKQSPPQFYYLYFKCNGTDYGQNTEEQVEFTLDKSNLAIQIKQSFQFGNFSLLKHCLENGGRMLYNKFIGEIYIKLSFTSENFIFTHCTGKENKEKRIDFINSLFKQDEASLQVEKTIKANTNKSNYIKSATLFDLLVGYDDIELVNHLSSIFKDALYDNNTFDLKLIAFIKSKEMLEYLFENHSFILNTGAWYFKDIQLFQHFESLANGTTKTIIPLPKFRFHSNSSNEILKYIIEKGPTSFKFDSISKMYSEINYYYPNDQGKFELMKSLFLNYQLNNEDKQDVCGTSFSKVGLYGFFGNRSCGLVRFLDWLFINHPNSLKNDKIDESEFNDYQDGIEITYYYLTGRFNQVPDDASIIKTIIYGFDITNTQSLDFICNRIKKTILNINGTKGSILSLAMYSIKMFQSLSFNGQLKLFEHVQQYHSWLFKPRSTKSNNNDLSLYTLKDLKSILFKSLNDDSLIISEFLFEFLPPLTIKEFNDNSTKMSKLVFKNKQFK